MDNAFIDSLGGIVMKTKDQVVPVINEAVASANYIKDEMAAQKDDIERGDKDSLETRVSERSEYASESRPIEAPAKAAEFEADREREAEPENAPADYQAEV